MCSISNDSMDISICMIYTAGSWTKTTTIYPDYIVNSFSDSGVAIYGSTIAIGTKDSKKVDIYSDAGSKQSALTVPDINSIAMYGSVVVVQATSYIYVFEKIFTQWTQTAIQSSTNIASIAMFGNFIVTGRMGASLRMILHSNTTCYLL